MPKFNKTKGFSLKSGNKTTFQQMGSGSPLDKTLIGNQKNLPDHLRAKIEDAPGKMYDTPGKMYDAPLKAEDDEDPKVEDKKELAKPADKLGVKIAKIAANAAIGGFDAATGSKTSRPTINFGSGKAEEEAKALTPGQIARKLSAKEETQKSREAINKDLTGTFAEFTKEGKLIPAGDPKHSSNITKKKSFQG